MHDDKTEKNDGGENVEVDTNMDEAEEATNVNQTAIQFKNYVRFYV